MPRPMNWPGRLFLQRDYGLVVVVGVGVVFAWCEGRLMWLAVCHSASTAGWVRGKKWYFDHFFGTC